MRSIWIAVSLLAFVIVGATVLFFVSSGQYHSMQESLDRIQQAVQEDNWHEAEKEASRLEERWNRADATWTPIMDHRQVDRLDESLTRVFHMVWQQEKKEALIEIAVARRLMRRLKNTEVPDLQNVF
ncbi:MAG: DUF4363 family protein [Bacillota bacterium]